MNVTFKSSTHAGRADPLAFKQGERVYSDLQTINRRAKEWLAWREYKTSGPPAWHPEHPDHPNNPNRKKRKKR